MQRLILAPLVLVAAGSFVACGSSGNSPRSTAQIGGKSSAKQQTGACKKVKAPPARRDGGERKPNAPLATDAVYEVTVTTNCGAFTIRIDQKTSPNAAASFVALARRGFFDDTVFHRIVPGFVIQGGDPTASGTGSPGYSTRDRVPQDTAYTRGVVAMAKSGVTPPGTAESQFYVVTSPDAGLPPEYAVIGRVVKGLDVTERIGKLGDPASGEQGTPLQPVVISSAAVTKR